MGPRQTSSDDRDDRQSAAMGEIRATLENAAREREETRGIMHTIQKTLTDIQIAMGRLVEKQEETSRRLAKIDDTIGDDKDGMRGRLTKIEGIQMLDQSEIADLDRRLKALEDLTHSANVKVIGALGAACLALATYILHLLHIVP